eukprot:CAMPEP_0195607528 /NCGR_PEP_ID=MMETSP0815-20121206/8264_1 /TAXON_ID=97485 /ORGANISM="Prymnesium parvum, Strain Texoma1" /LENGTH=136 /DNA_ID=CAMNT_0040747337 /DNA_START=461 /DNA_END=871 /DNA_ORIENTATION=+
MLLDLTEIERIRYGHCSADQIRGRAMLQKAQQLIRAQGEAHGIQRWRLARQLDMLHCSRYVVVHPRGVHPARAQVIPRAVATHVDAHRLEAARVEVAHDVLYVRGAARVVDPVEDEHHRLLGAHGQAVLRPPVQHE